MKKDLQKGNITAIVNIKKNKPEDTAYIIELKSSEAVNPQNIQVLQSILKDVINTINSRTFPQAQTIASIDNNIEKIPGRDYRRIDFILPGQLGFSLLSAGVFGVAFMFLIFGSNWYLNAFLQHPSAADT